MPKLITQEDFIFRAKQIHGDKYDYSKVILIGMIKPVTLICKVHGEFQQIASNHVYGRGSGCKACALAEIANRKKLTQSEFLKRAREIHGDVYDYSESEFICTRTKLTIICKHHGRFFKTPNGHLIKRAGCPKCARIISSEKLKITDHDIISKCKAIHGDTYKYSFVERVGHAVYIRGICREHGEFRQLVSSHIGGLGCRQCYIENMRKSNSEYIAEVIGKHGERYIYDRVKYKGLNYDIEVGCKLHGYFMTNAGNHLKRGSDCSACVGKLPITNTELDRRLLGSPVKRVGDCHGIDTPIEFMCLKSNCGKTWPARPANVMRGSECPHCAERGFNQSKPSVVYVYAINERYCGYGITSYFEQRDDQHQKAFKKNTAYAELITTYECSGTQAQQIERLIQKTFPIVNTGIEGFKKEATHLHNLPAVLNLISNALDNPI